MKVTCVVPPLHFPVNEFGHGYQPPLGLLSVAGPLVDSGFYVELLDADAAHMSIGAVVEHLQNSRPEVVLVGHSGSMAANPAALHLLTEIKSALPLVTTIYGGVYPTYAWHELMSHRADIDFIVCGEGEETTLELLTALRSNVDAFDNIAGLVWRSNLTAVKNQGRKPIKDLDEYRVAWELADWSLYPGRHLPGRSAIVQFSRGCPNTCTYCGQWAFWKRWRHRRVVRFVDELQTLREKYDVRTLWIADENWASNQAIFLHLLREISARNLGLSIFCAVCAEDVIRDSEQLALYRSAGVVCLMMGVESFDDAVLSRVGKHNPASLTLRAVRALRENGILSVLNVIYGLRDETWQSLWKTVAQLRHLSPDFFNALHFTPLGWTEEGRAIDPALIVQTDQQKWDFRQPVIRPKNFSPRGLALLVKFLELVFYLRPAWLLRSLFERDPVKKKIIRDATPRLARVYLYEVCSLLISRFVPAERPFDDIRLHPHLMPGRVRVEPRVDAVPTRRRKPHI